MHHFFKYRKAILALFPVLFILSLWSASQMQFKHVYKDFIPGGDTDFDFLADFNDRLEEDDRLLFVGIDNQQSILDSVFLEQVNQFTEQCKTLPAVQSVQSITTVKDIVIGPFGPIDVPLVHFRKKALFPKDSLRLAKDPRIIDHLVSKDFEATTIVLKTISGLRQEDANDLHFGLETLLANSPFPKSHVAGKATLQATFVKKAKEEVLFYILLFTGLIIAILYWLYRSFWGVIIPVISVFSGFTFFFAYLQLSGQNLDIMSTLFPTLLLIFVMADIVHLQTKYIDTLELGFSRAEAMTTALKEIGLALLLTSVTTAVGFFSLLTSQVKAIRAFGFNSGVGVILAFLLVVIFSASALLLFDHRQLSKAKKQSELWKKLMFWCHNLNNKAPRSIWAFTFLLLIVSGIGISLISTNSLLTGDFPSKGKLRSDYAFFEQKFGGTRSFEIATLPQDNYLVSASQVLYEVNKLEEHVTSTFQMQTIASPITVYKSVNKALNGGHPEAYLFPDTNQLGPHQRFIKQNQLLVQNKVASEDGKLARLSLKMRDPGSEEAMAINEQIATWIHANTDTSIVQFRFTGINYMVDKNNRYMIWSLFYSLGLAFVVVALIFAAIFKDLKLVLISLIPNIFPLLVAGAAMGFLGIELKAVTSVIFAVSFGIAVDDTIHFLTRYQLERKKGQDIDKALRNTFLKSGKAMLLTTLILLTGFLSLIFSEFNGSFYIGLLVSITLFSALVADFFLIPQLLRLMTKEKNEN